MTPQEVADLPVVMGVVNAGRVFGLGRDASYNLARLGEFPVPVMRLGRRYVVTRAALLQTLGMPDVPSKPLTRPMKGEVRDVPADSQSAGGGAHDRLGDRK